MNYVTSFKIVSYIYLTIQTKPVTEASHRESFMVLTSHFSKKTLAALSRKGVEVVGMQAIPAFEGDVYFSGTAYILNAKGTQLVRTHSQVLVMSTSSWTSESNSDRE